MFIGYMPIISDNYPMKGLFQCPLLVPGIFLYSHSQPKAQSHHLFFYICIIHLPAPTKLQSLINPKPTVFSFHKSASEAILKGVKNISMCERKECELQHCNMRMDK